MTQSPSPKRVSESATHDQTALVFPNDLNSLGTLFGGRVLELADRVTAVVSQRHSGRVCVTLGIDSVRFLGPARHGDILVFQSAVNRVWRTSMEVGVKVFAENFKTLHRRHIFSAYFTFVALDDDQHPIEIAAVIPETVEEQRRYRQAGERRQARLEVRSP
jgi:acyl-CoA hydrolase